MIIIGVDPGVSGGIAILNTYSYRTVECLSFAHNTLSDIYLYLSEIRGGEVDRIARANHRNPTSVAPRANCSVAPRANHTTPISKAIKSIKSPLPAKDQVLEEDYHPDNTMEMWLENPGQIIVNSRTKGKDSTGALLAGMNASRKLGRSVGQWEGIAAALNISVNLVPPKKWQSTLNSKTGGDKNISKNVAISLFPFLTDSAGKSKITHDVADSLLIAVYGYLQYADPKYLPKVVSQQIDKSTHTVDKPSIPNKEPKNARPPSSKRCIRANRPRPFRPTGRN